jgi:hypothetical protein
MLSTNSQKIIPTNNDGDQQVELVRHGHRDIENNNRNDLQNEGNGEEAKSDLGSNSDADNYTSSKNLIAPDFKNVRRRGKFGKMMERISSISYDDVKGTTRYLMESATIQFSVSVRNCIFFLFLNSPFHSSKTSFC